MELRAGTEVNDNVRLERPIGAGGMGQVWVAQHLTLKIPVAVKLMRDKLSAADAVAVRRFSEEASTAARIKSPHVVQTLDSGVMSDGTPFIVMELLEGESLGDKVARAPLSLADTTRVVTHVCKALEAAHKLAIVHRDIKPDNIFLSTTDEGLVAKVFDFGISSRMVTGEGSEAAVDLAGTPAFLSPEQFRGYKADRFSDLWAVAVVAYECLTGELPFGGATLGLLSVNVVSSSFLPPSQIRSDLPREIDAWFKKALAPEKAGRFDSARTMARALTLAARLDDKLSPHVARNRWSGTAVGGLLVGVIAAGAVAWLATRTTVDNQVTGVVVAPLRAPENRVAVAPKAPPSDAPSIPTAPSAQTAPSIQPAPMASAAETLAGSPPHQPHAAPLAKTSPSNRPIEPAAPHTQPKTGSPKKGEEDYGF